MSKIFTCWYPDYDGGPAESPGKNVYAYNAELAAEKFCRLNHGEWDYSMDEKEILVRDENGNVHVFDVDAEAEIKCTARERK